MATKLPSMKVVFCVTGMSFDPHECARHFGIEATKVRIKGDPIPPSKNLVRESSWWFESAWQTLDSTNDALRILMEMIWPRRTVIRNFCQKKKLSITFVLQTRDALGKRNFLNDFSSRTIQQIGYFRAPLCIDMY